MVSVGKHCVERANESQVVSHAKKPHGDRPSPRNALFLPSYQSVTYSGGADFPLQPPLLPRLRRPLQLLLPLLLPPLLLLRTRSPGKQARMRYFRGGARTSSPKTTRSLQLHPVTTTPDTCDTSPLCSASHFLCCSFSGSSRSTTRKRASTACLVSHLPNP